MGDGTMDTTGSLSANLINFSRLLRRAGLPVGPAEMLAAHAALTLIEIGDRAAVRTALRTTMVQDRKSTRLNSSHIQKSRMPSSA